MFQTLMSVIGLLMVSVPRKIVDAAETLAFENPEDATLRGWTIPMARVEGIGYLLFARRSGFLSGAVSVVFGLFGSMAAILPHWYLNFGLSLAYENPDEITVKSWVIPVTRILGVTAFVLTVVSLRSETDN
ncbi:hypothetical protein ACFQGE_05070 [Halomicroarcula sp. GCM10025817]|uniref:hypothetical protein n=1 Tax=Haloarcula TaxID=2237 RepID=UPI0023E8EAD4|nr:hypothetical protein [Halomicroarcula sp. SYNS111]